MKKIELTQGKFAIVDNEDFEWLNQWKWHYNNSDGYAYRTKVFRRINGKQPKEHISIHRLINKTPKGMETDHINHNRLDNRKNNLRTVNRVQNCMNTSIRKDNKSGFKGVSFSKDRQKWMACIKFDNKVHNLGRFITKEEAALAYNQMAKIVYSKFAYLNQI